MTNGLIIIISILVLSIVLLAVVGLISFKKMKPAIKNFNDLNTDVQQLIEFYKHKSQDIMQEVQTLKQDVLVMQDDVELKNLSVQEFSDRQRELQSSLTYLQNHLGDYSKGIAMNAKNEIQKDGPKMFKIFKRAFKKTARKQKQRFKTNKKAEEY